MHYRQSAKRGILYAIILSAVVLPSLTSADSAVPTFVQNHQLWDEGPDIVALQQYLNAQGYLISTTGVGSPGHETSFFGPLTYRALVKFQTAEGLPPTGYFGPMTRAKIVELPSTRSSSVAPQTQASEPATSPIASEPSTRAPSTSPLCTAPAGLTCYPGTAIIQPWAPGNGYTPGFGGGGGDRTAPVITVNGANPMTIAQGSTFTDPGATATDNVDGTDSVSASGSVDTSMVGIYTLTYSATDEAGNTATATRTINVTDQTPPIISSIATSSVTDTSVTITWTTNEAATSSVSYGTSTSYGTASSSSALVTSHSITLTGLSAETTYHFELGSADAQGNPATSSDQTLMTFSSQAQLFFSRLASQPTTARKTAYDTMTSGLVNAGVWSKLDGLYVFAAADAPTARTNLIQSSYGATVVGNPTFAVDAGYAGDNTIASYLETSFDPTVGTPNFARNSSFVAAWKNTNQTNDVGIIASMTGQSGTFLQPFPSDGHFYYDITGGAGLPAHIASSTGLFEAARSDSTHVESYIRGIPLGTVSGVNSVASVAGKTLRFLADGSAQGSDSQLAVGAFGSSFTDADSRNLSVYINNYLLAVGAASASSSLLGFSSDVVNDGANNLSPGLARLKDGRLLAVYSVGSGGAQQNAVIVYRTSSNNGATWSSATTVASPASSHTYLDTSATVLSDGTILISGMLEANDGSTVVTQIHRGTVAGDLSISWGSPISISSAMANPGTSSYVLPLANGTLMLALYGNNGESQSVRVVFSSDEGQTWGNETAVATNGTGEIFSESNYVQLTDGTIIGVLRNDGSSHGYWLTKSTDNGATWSTPTQIFNNTVSSSPGRPALSITPAGKLFLVGRFIDPSGAIEQAGYTYSADGGATWSTPVSYEDITNNLGTGNFSYGQYVYAQGFYDTTTNSLLYAIGQGSFSAAEIIFQQFNLQ